jgi:hypothetical protein
VTDGVTVGAWLLVAGPVVGTICLFYPPLFRIWTAPREQHLALAAAHRFAWTMANVGFTVATVATAGGLVVLATSADVDSGWRAVLSAGAVAYTVAGTLWCAGLAIRTRLTPALAALVAAGKPTEPAEGLIGSATGGLFASFFVTTGLALTAIGLALALGGGVAVPVALLATLVSVLALAGFVAFDDMLPAVLYLPTLLIGIALLLGWS